jgi:hypothetical protein
MIGRTGNRSAWIKWMRRDVKSTHYTSDLGRGRRDAPMAIVAQIISETVF